MITVSEKEKYVCIWGNPAYVDTNMIQTYKAQGYTIVKLSNGAGNIRDCIRTVAKTSNIL